MNRLRPLRLLFGTIILALVAVSVMTYRSLRRFSEEHEAIGKGHLSLRAMEGMLSALKESRTALRDLRRTHDPAFIASLQEAGRNFNYHEDAARYLALDTSEGLRVDSLGGLVDSVLAKMHGLRPVADLPDTLVDRRADEAGTLLRTARGVHRRMMRDKEARVKASRSQQERIGVATPMLLLAFAVLSLLAVSLLFVRALRSSGMAARAEQEIKKKVVELDAEIRTRKFAERSLRRVLDSSVSAIMAFRSVRASDGRIEDFEWILANHQAEMMLGRDVASLMGTRLLEVLPAMTMSGLFERFVEVVTTGRAMRLDNVYDVNGLGLHLDINAVKLGDGLVVTYTDVSDREHERSVLRESERLALTGKIARTIAHEVRNPLTNVLLSIDQMKEDPEVYAAIRPYVGIVQRNVDRIAQLITEMLDSSKPRDTDRRPCDVGVMLDDAVALVNDRIDLRQMGLARDLDPGLPPVSVDREEIKVALANIIINAVEAMEPGKGRLRLSASGQQGRVRIVVQDNGKGMTADELSRLFDPFYTGRPGGMGLGLTAARSILNSHGVHVDVNSKVGEGTVFTLLFPAGPHAVEEDGSAG